MILDASGLLTWYRLGRRGDRSERLINGLSTVGDSESFASVEKNDLGVAKFSILFAEEYAKLLRKIFREDIKFQWCIRVGLAF